MCVMRERLEVCELGADDLLAKPLNIQHLLTRHHRASSNAWTEHRKTPRECHPFEPGEHVNVWPGGRGRRSLAGKLRQRRAGMDSCTASVEAAAAYRGSSLLRGPARAFSAGVMTSLGPGAAPRRNGRRECDRCTWSPASPRSSDRWRQHKYHPCCSSVTRDRESRWPARSFRADQARCGSGPACRPAAGRQ